MSGFKKKETRKDRSGPEGKKRGWHAADRESTRGMKRGRLTE